MPEFQITPTESGFAARARARFAERWERTMRHTFVRELFEGTVSDAVLARYLVQDYQFFDDFVRVIAAAVVATDRPETRVRLSHQLGVLADDEDTYFQRSFDALGVAEDAWRSPDLAPATAGFLSAMRSAVSSGSVGDQLVVLVVAEWLYLDWAAQSEALPERDEHLGWIELHRSSEYTEWTQFLVDELDRVAATLSHDERERLFELFGHMLTLEEAFFDDAYRD